MAPRTTRSGSMSTSSATPQPPPVASTSRLAGPAPAPPGSALSASSGPADPTPNEATQQTTTSTAPDKKRKKLPACDACKLRRVLCKPQPLGISCPRCRDKGIVCTTTPTVRKKAAGRSGKRIEEARAMFGAADPNAPDFMGASNTPWIQPRLHQQGQAGPSVETLATAVREPKLSAEDLDNKLAFETLNGALVAHLLELYQALPQSWLPIGVRGRMSLLFEAAGRRLDALAPQAEVLAHAMIALTSRLSSHPALFTPGGPIPSFESLTPISITQTRDLREFGRRREHFCEKLKRRAVKLAWDRGTLVKTSEESMATCYLLEMLEGRTDPKAGKPYGSAFVSHLRTLLDSADEPGAAKVMNMSLGWSALIMREALYATNAGRCSHFTATDDRLLCGDPPVAIETALLETVDDVDLRDTVTLFFRPFRPYTYHCASLARSLSDNVTGTFARRQPLDELFVAKYLTHLDHLLHLFAVLEARIALVLSPAATSAHALPAPFEQERQFIMRACLYTLSLAWAGLSLPLYLDLKRRVAVLENPPSDPPPAHTVASQQRTLDRLHLLVDQVHAVTLKAARMVAQCVHEAPSLAFLTHLQSENLEKWSRVLIEAPLARDGRHGLAPEERRSDLTWILEGLKTSGWSWADLDPLIAEIEHALDADSLAYRPPAEDTAMDRDDQMREVLQGNPPLSEGLPHPPQRFSVEQDLHHAPVQQHDGPSPASSDGFDFSSLLQGSQAPSPASLAMPDLSSLTSFFGGASTAPTPPSGQYAPPPTSAAVPPQMPRPTPSTEPLATDARASEPLPPLGPPPDLSTLITAYLNGSLVFPPGLDINALSSRFLMGTLDITSLWETYGRSVTINGQPLVGQAAGSVGVGGGTGGTNAPGSGRGNGTESPSNEVGTPGGRYRGPSGLDFDALLEHELYREPSSGIGGGGGGGAGL
ncbi:hypothetical protein JCM10212_001557 [Sporobolomyces blumeae]